MPHLSIEGGRPLTGSVPIDGAKNAALPACVAALLTDERVRLRRVPRLRDVETILSTIASLGKRIERDGDVVDLLPGGKLGDEPDETYVAQMRASFLVLGPLVARLGRATVPLPGGCSIGARPVDLHLDGLRAMGASIEMHDHCVHVRADGLRGAHIRLPIPSVGATEQLLTSATLATGETCIEGPAREPEVEDLIALLRKMGAEIAVEPNTIRIVGGPRLRGADHMIIPDRLEAGTYLLAGAVTRGEVEVRGVDPAPLRPLIRVLDDAGMRIAEDDDRITLRADGRARPIQVITAPHPGYPTDLHPPLAVLLSLGAGTGRIEERVFEHRFGYVPSLCKMGSRIDVRGRTAVITGVAGLCGASVSAPDIRAGAALVLAGLAAKGSTAIAGIEQIDRGYASIETKLSALGGRIERQT